MKALHECFPDQKKNVDAMTSFDNVMTWNHFLKETNCICLPPESMYARMRGCESMHARMVNLSQCMPEYGDGFCKILLALWATWFVCFLFFVVVVVVFFFFFFLIICFKVFYKKKKP
jgi:hypothetical protein